MYKTVHMTIGCTDKHCARCQNLRARLNQPDAYWCALFGNLLDDTRGDAKRAPVCMGLFEKAQ